MISRNAFAPAACLAAALLLTTCGRDDPSSPPVTTPPPLTSIRPEPWTRLSGIVVIEVDAAGADTVSLKVDGSPVTLATGPGPGELFQLSWDTRIPENGPHDVRLTARNAAGSADSTLVLVCDNPGRGVAVLVTPREAVVAPGDAVAFQATVLGTSQTDVTWSLVPPQLGAGGGPATPGTQPRTRWGGVTNRSGKAIDPGDMKRGESSSAENLGTISSSGVYRAPRTIPFPPHVWVRARSVADPSKSAEARIQIAGPLVVVTPQTREVTLNQSAHFSVEVTGAVDPAVDWSVDESPVRGTISADGVYTTPATLPDPPRAVIRARLRAEPSRGDSAVVELLPLVMIVVRVSPDSIELPPGGQVMLTAVVTGATNRTVRWSLVSRTGTGSVSAEGVYRAPVVRPDPPEALVRAVSVEDSAAADTARIHLRAVSPIQVRLSPKSATVVTGGRIGFTAVVSRSDDHRLTWSVPGGPQRGQVPAGGWYTAPEVVPDPPEAMFIATSVAEPTVADTAVVTIVPPPSPIVAQQLAALSETGYQSVLISDQATALAVRALWLASQHNGGRITTSGTLRHSASGWSYLPGDSLSGLVIDRGGPAIRIFTTGIDTLSWAEYADGGISGVAFHGVLICRVEVEGTLDLRINHATDSNHVDLPFQRTVRGTLQTGPIRRLTVNHSGHFYQGPHAGGADYRITGQVETDDMISVSLNERFELGQGDNCYWIDGSWGQQWSRTINNWASLGGPSYSLTAVVTGCRVGACRQQDGPHACSPAYWQAQGVVLHGVTDGGTVGLDGPAVSGGVPPQARIFLPDGSSVMLHAPGLPPVVEIVPALWER